MINALNGVITIVSLRITLLISTMDLQVRGSGLQLKSTFELFRKQDNWRLRLFDTNRRVIIALFLGISALRRAASEEIPDTCAQSLRAVPSLS